MASLHQSGEDQSARMPTILVSPLMATPRHVATMHVGKPQHLILTISRSFLCYSSIHLSITAACIDHFMDCMSAYHLVCSSSADIADYAAEQR